MFYEQTPKQSGVTANRKRHKSEYGKQLSKLHLKGILGKMSHSHNLIDSKVGRIGSKATVDSYFDVLKKHNFLCAYSKIPLGKNDFSFDRLDNRKTHGTVGNVVPCLRFLNCTDRSTSKNARDDREDNGNGWSTTKIAQVCLFSKYMQLTEYERRKLEEYVEKNKHELNGPHKLLLSENEIHEDIHEKEQMHEQINNNDNKELKFKRKSDSESKLPNVANEISDEEFLEMLNKFKKLDKEEYEHEYQQNKRNNMEERPIKMCKKEQFNKHFWQY